MSNFTIRKLPEIKGKQVFYELVVTKPSDRVEEKAGVLGQFQANLEGKYESGFKSILTIMNLVANLQSVPKNKFRDITPAKEHVKEYEFKYGDLRVYGIKTDEGKLIMLGGFKNQQEQDIVAFRSLKRQYLNQLKK